jgi:hypothetical protein
MNTEFRRSKSVHTAIFSLTGPNNALQATRETRAPERWRYAEDEALCQRTL